MSELQVGDVVRVKSGGPKMTISSIGDNYGQMSVWCEWFTEKNAQASGVFSLASVEKVPPEAPGGSLHPKINRP